jgi:hypothetical protein
MELFYLGCKTKSSGPGNFFCKIYFFSIEFEITASDYRMLIIESIRYFKTIIRQDSNI